MDCTYHPHFSGSGQEYLMVLPVPQGREGSFKHLVLQDRRANSSQPLTSGNWEVTDILAWDKVKNIM